MFSLKKHIMFAALFLFFAHPISFAATTAATPVIIFPSDSTYRVADTLTFVWSDTSGHSISYEIQITSDPTFSAIMIDSSDITDTTFTITTPLSHGSPYYWRIRAKSGIDSSLSAYTNSAMFVVAINGVSGAQIPVPSWPIDGKYLYSDSTDLSWYLSYADSSLVFDVMFSLDSTFSTTIIDSSGITGTSLSVNGLLTDTTYYWKVRSRDAIHPDTSMYSPVAHFKVIKFNSQPILSWPIGGNSIYQPDQTFSWYLNGPPLSITYDFTLSLNPDLSAPDTVATGLTSRSISISGLRSGKTYYWQVISHLNGHADSSTVESFYVVQSSGPVVPVLSWPIGNNYVYSNVPTLVWYVNSTGTGLTYEIRYALDTTALDTTTGIVTSNLYYTVASPLLSDTTYYWQVRSMNGTDTSAFSAPDSFKVAMGSGNPVVPILSTPVNGINVYTYTPTLSWYINTPSPGLTYELRYSQYKDSLSNAPVYSTGSSTDYTIVSPLPYDTVYYWQVRSRSATDSSAFCSPDSFTVATGSGNIIVPVPSWPIGGATVYPNPPVLNWYLNFPLSGLKFEVEYSINPDMSGAVSASNIDTNQYQIPSALTEGATYFWRVRSYNTTLSDSSDWSPIESFVTSTVGGLVVPRIGGPTNGVKLNAGSPMFTWYLPTSGSKTLTYEIQYSTKSDFSNPVTVNNVANTAAVISNLLPGQTYFWRVRSAKGSTNSLYSAAGSFTTAIVTGVNSGTVPLTFEVKQNYPNPFNPSTVIDYSVPKNMLVTIKIYNMLGQEVKTLVNDQQGAGPHSVTWNGDNDHGMHVSSGIYLYRVVAGVNTVVKKMILLK